ncbi:MAG: TspO/MBR family protein [Bacteroidota bacterium]
MFSRWLALAISFLSFPLNYLSNYIGSAPGIKDVTNKYASLFTPAGYAFSIWGLIYLSWFIYSIFSVLPAERKKPVYDKLSPLLAVSGIMGMAWQFIFRFGYIGLSLIWIFFMLVIALILFNRVQNFVKNGGSRWVSTPFNMYAGWLSVASIANASIWLISVGLRGHNEAGYANAMITIAVSLGLYIASGYRDFVYPAVIAWALAAIAVARKYDSEAVFLYACAGSAVVLVGSLTSIVLGRREKLNNKIGSQNTSGTFTNR